MKMVLIEICRKNLALPHSIDLPIDLTAEIFTCSQKMNINEEKDTGGPNRFNWLNE